MKALLFPLSFIYGMIIFCRNYLYNLGVFKSVKFKVPVISVGNITVGGTGKTPHTEYLIHLLKDKFNLALLSRGYKRKTRGFFLATVNSTYKMIGDEPYQIKKKFPEIVVAVDSDRVNGINLINELVPEVNVIILDDAFQHRHVSPGLNILLIDFNRPIHTDSLLPYGLLREPFTEKKRADIIIVTKIPENLSVEEKMLFTKQTGLLSQQSIYFTSVRYGQPTPVFNQIETNESIDFNNSDLSVLLVTGIADPNPIINNLSKTYKSVIPLIFPDHYAYSQHDIAKIVRHYHKIHDNKKVIITTEKDAVRFSPFNLKENIPSRWYYIPIEITFFPEESEIFNNQILQYVSNHN